MGSAAALTAGALYPLLHPEPSAALAGDLLGASFEVGHLLRGGSLPAPSSDRKTTVAIVGGGVAGLSAGWKLARAGVGEFEILELEPECGGNSRHGESEISRYPWGAHYVPTPTEESRAVRELFAELGAIEADDAAGRPIYKEEYLCFSPQERLFIHGRWQEGLLPSVGATRRDLDEYARFHDLVHALRKRRGRDGRRAFAIPMELSSRDAELLALDRSSMHDFLVENGFGSPGLHWYVDYACRDDFGCRSRDVSAWAGLHYFAARDEESSVLTWPEGNGWIVERLRQKLAARIHTNALVFAIEEEKAGVVVDVFDPRERTSTRVRADLVIFAAPELARKHVLAGGRDSKETAEFQYAPWLVANLTLSGFPSEREGMPRCWDNVLYDSDALGYVVATHQSLRTHHDGTVFTYYYPLAGSSPDAERRRLLETSWSAWAEWIFRDLSKAHPDIRGLATRLDVFRWGHAMVRPRPGFVWGEARRRAAEPSGRVYFAHSDLSGFSIFEEAQYRGVAAAEQALARLGVRFSSSL